MLNLDMGGTVVPKTGYVGPDSVTGAWFVFADFDGCNVYPVEVITWKIASSPH